jgi:hypothetical protein
VYENNQVDLTLDNTGSSSRTISEIRYSFFLEDSQGGAGVDPPDYVEINGEVLTMRGEYKSVGNPTISPGENTLAMCFYHDQAATNGYDFDPGDFFIVSVRYDTGFATYFVPPVQGTTSGDCTGGGGGGGNGGGGSSISSADVSDIGDSNDESQTLTFTLARDYADGEEVTINLDDPQKNNQVDYQDVGNNDVSVTSDGAGGGDATITASSQDAEITYTADAADGNGDQITIEVGQIDASDSQASENAPYDVVFQGPDGDTMTEQFSVS